MSSTLETSFREILGPVTSALGFEVMRQEWGGRCSEIRLRSSLLEVEVFHDVIDEASVRIRFLENRDSGMRGYTNVLNETLGSDFGLPEYLGGWSDRGFLPPDIPKVFAVLAETLSTIINRPLDQNA